jgi:hypothetical protein
VVIDYLNVKSVTLTPPKTYPPLPVDPNAVLALAIAFQRLELIRARNRKVFQVSSRVELLQLHEGPLLSRTLVFDRLHDNCSIAFTDIRPA